VRGGTIVAGRTAGKSQFPANLKTHCIRTGAGHYGVFSGKRWAGQIYLVVRDVIHVSD